MKKERKIEIYIYIKWNCLPLKFPLNKDEKSYSSVLVSNFYTILTQHIFKEEGEKKKKKKKIKKKQ